ncbi:oxygen-dependent tRNA uridine(34) hydroxylase TrhO [Dokdonella sp. MW10]|uniref:oxygen-dependent tRNA uridine(34) hydroxylase TrhO n=1 Tax=Dokdonella sp. MW10 TaxID=2992926 RepID=UPI003F7FF149
MFTHVAGYRFVEIDDPDTLVGILHARADALALRGTILVAREGLNLFLAGAPASVDAFLRELRDDVRFAGLPVHVTGAETLPYARLKVCHKREIITFRDDDTSPLHRRAPGVTPAALARWIAQGCDDGGRRVVLLDTRNREEVAHGTFAGAVTLPIDRFTELPTAIDALRDGLRDATVVSFCTGGIRCEKAALWMGDHGIGDVVQLEGGILGYFAQVGGYGYEGECFVFDGRVALAPPATD